MFCSLFNLLYLVCYTAMVQRYVISTNTLFGRTDDSDSGRSEQVESVDDEAPPLKRSKLFANYSCKPSVNATSSSLQQINRYLEMQDIEEDCLQFWHRSQTALDKLYHPAMRALSVPASSAAVERVFSQGGIICRPHRARMTDKLLSQLLFLKCNELKGHWQVNAWWIDDEIDEIHFFHYIRQLYILNKN